MCGGSSRLYLQRGPLARGAQVVIVRSSSSGRRSFMRRGDDPLCCARAPLSRFLPVPAAALVLAGAGCASTRGRPRRRTSMRPSARDRVRGHPSRQRGAAPARRQSRRRPDTGQAVAIALWKSPSFQATLPISASRAPISLKPGRCEIRLLAALPVGPAAPIHAAVSVRPARAAPGARRCSAPQRARRRGASRLGCAVAGSAGQDGARGRSRSRPASDARRETPR